MMHVGAEHGSSLGVLSAGVLLTTPARNQAMENPLSDPPSDGPSLGVRSG
jgi:hypothetical protein